ncbi:MAG: acyl-CoA dehydrogenase, partial [Polynucleobacter sp.]|nr:acyl-CoA dehydrogenase [Polynucleobacter sp.]
MRIDEATLSHLQEWIGKSERYPDQVTAAPYRALSATLDRNDPEPNPGVFLPELWHWLYFLPHPQQSEIGPDGHAKRGGF